MEIPVIGRPIFDIHGVKESPVEYQPHTHDQEDTHGPDELAEFAGRNCYQSWDRPRPETATNKGYLANILKQGHESVLEHSSITFYVSGVSRALLTELERHRHLSFSVVSQRYVDSTTLRTVYPPLLDELHEDDAELAVSVINYHAERSLSAYSGLVKLFSDAGFPRKKAREAARAVLPNSTDSPMVVTGNLRAWRDVLRKRYHVAADAEIREFASKVLEQLRQYAPNSFQDFPNTPFGDN